MTSDTKKKILILCTGNSCRSQMAEGFAHKAGWQAFSAGIKPEGKVNPFAVEVMAEMCIDISLHTPQSVDEYLSDDFYLIVTVCDSAWKNCPVFKGTCEHQIHYDLEDPANAEGSDKEIIEVYRRVRDKIQVWIDEISGNYLNN